MVPAATIEAIIARVCREGDLTKKALLAEWPEVRDTYPLMRSLVLRDQRVIAGLKGIGGFRATAAIADEVAKAASEEGFLSRRAACRRWRLNDRDYSKVRQEVLHHADIERGGGRGGGFRAALSTEPTVEDPDRDVTIDPGIALLDWQRAAVELIAEALQRTIADSRRAPGWNHQNRHSNSRGRGPSQQKGGTGGRARTQAWP